jgi:hypothetical protein
MLSHLWAWHEGLMTVPKKGAERTAKGMAGGDIPPLSPAAAKAARIISEYHQLWWPLKENRIERKRKLLPNLKLKYPTDDEISRLAKLMNVNDASRLSGSIRSVILSAHLFHEAFQTLSIPKVREACEKVAGEAAQLKQTLSELDVGRGAKGSQDEAGSLIEEELFASKRQLDLLLPKYIELLDGLGVAAQQAAKRQIYSPRGAGGNPAFDMLIQQLQMASRMHGGKFLKVYRSRDDKWVGSLMDALEILKGCLPQWLVTGRSVDHINKKFMDSIKTRRTVEGIVTGAR